MEAILENLKSQLNKMKSETDKRQNVYNWMDNDVKGVSRKCRNYAEDTDILRDSCEKLESIISDLELLIPKK